MRIDFIQDGCVENISDLPRNFLHKFIDGAPDFENYKIQIETVFTGQVILMF